MCTWYTKVFCNCCAPGTTTRQELAEALSGNPGYRLNVVGHSLGGAVAVLLTQMLREHDPFKDVHCFTFACPSCLSQELAESCKPFVTTLITNADLVPYVSFSKVTDLQSQIVNVAFEQQVLKKWRQQV